MAEKRNSYLVSKALKSFMFASILAALAQQVATTTDAIVVSHLIGPDAMSAVNLVMPVLSLCTCIGYLFGMGASGSADGQPCVYYSGGCHVLHWCLAVGRRLLSGSANYQRDMSCG